VPRTNTVSTLLLEVCNDEVRSTTKQRTTPNLRSKVTADAYIVFPQTPFYLDETTTPYVPMSIPVYYCKHINKIKKRRKKKTSSLTGAQWLNPQGLDTMGKVFPVESLSVLAVPASGFT